jgi:SNF2 family DNA or RNA helicase
VDRAFRIGQTKDVFVYRLIMAGTVEEKIYEKQVIRRISLYKLVWTPIETFTENTAAVFTN